MCIVSKKSNTAYSIGICVNFLNFVKKNRNLYENPLELQKDFKSLEERGVIQDISCRNNECSLTLVLNKGGQPERKVTIEGVDQLQCLFFISNIEQGNHECKQPGCELPCCVVKRLTTIIQ